MDEIILIRQMQQVSISSLVTTENFFILFSSLELICYFDTYESFSVVDRSRELAMIVP